MLLRHRLSWDVLFGSRSSVVELKLVKIVQNLLLKELLCLSGKIELFCESLGHHIWGLTLPDEDSLLGTATEVDCDFHKLFLERSRVCDWL